MVVVSKLSGLPEDLPIDCVFCGDWKYQELTCYVLILKIKSLGLEPYNCIQRLLFSDHVSLGVNESGGIGCEPEALFQAVPVS